MLIVDRALIRETLLSSLAVMLVFIALFMTVTLVNIMAKAAVGDIPVGLIFVLLGLRTVHVLGQILPLALFVGILLTLGRWYRDSEMTVLAACGIGLLRFLRPMLVLTLGYMLAAGLFAFYLSPLAVGLTAKVRAEGTTRSEVSDIAPGVFNEIRDGGGFFYAEKLNREDGTLEGVFLSREEQGRFGVMLARSGRQYTDEATGDRFLLFRNGTRYEGTPGRADYRVVEYENYAVRIEPRPAPAAVTGHDAVPTLRLLAATDLQSRVEWQWRLSKVAAPLVLALFAMVFAYNNARSGRYTGLFIAVLVYFVYSNLLGVGNALLKQGRIPVALGLWWVHGLAAVLAVWWLRRRHANLPLLPALRPRWRRARRA